MKIISIASSKGGVGKTTTVTNLGYALSKIGHRILLIDVDKQGNLANYFNLTSEKTLASFLKDTEKGVDIITVRENLDLINSGKERLADTEKLLVMSRSPVKAMAKSFASLNGYDYVFLDLGPSLSLINENALFFCDEVFIPCSIGFFDMTGVDQLLRTIADISKEERPTKPINLRGIFINMFDKRTKLSEQIEAALKERFKKKLLKTKVRKNVAIAEAPAFHLTIQEYAPNSHGCQDFNELAEEFLNSE